MNLLSQLAMPVFILLPALLFFGVAWFATRRGDPLARYSRWAPVFCALVLAAITTFFVYLLASSRSSWPESTEIAWTAIRGTRPAAVLQIGGDREGVVSGWPNGQFTPQLRLAQADEGKAILEVLGGGALVRAEGEIVNGAELRFGEQRSVGDFDVSLVRRRLFGRALSISAGGRETARVPLGAASVLRARALLPRLARRLNDLRASSAPEDALLALKLEDWARDVVFLQPSRGIVHLVRRGPEDQGKRTIALPASVTIQWPGVNLHAEARAHEGGGIQLRFLPPWRLASPLPPEREGKAKRQLVVTAAPEPGDHAFVLPLGAGITDPRRHLELTVEPDGRALFVEGTDVAPDSGNGSDPTATLLGQGKKARRDQPSQPARAGSSIEVAAGDFAFQLHTLRDLPVPRTLALALVVGLGAFGFGLVLLGGRLWSKDLWVACGFLLVAWDLVALRFLLAIRYVSDPRALDLTSIKGLSTALGSLAFVPGAIVLAAVLYRVAYLRVDDYAALRRAMGATLGYGLAIFAAGTYLTSLPGQLLPNLPERLRPSLIGGAALLVTLLWLLLMAALFASHLRAARSAAGLEGVGELPLLGLPVSLFLVPSRIVHRWGEGMAALLDLASSRDPGRTLEEAGFRLRSFLVAAATVLVTVALAFWLLGELLPNVLQDIVAPFAMGGLVGLAWLSISIRALPEDFAWRRVRQWLAAILLAGISLGFAAYGLPALLGDIGGIFAALSFLLPLLFLLAVSRAWKPGIVGLTVVLVGGVVAYNSLFALFNVAPGIFERGRSRIVAFREGVQSQKRLPGAEGTGEGSPGAVTVDSLRDAIQHRWENEAIAHEGGLFGQGFGKAPDFRSQIRRDTLQFDSTFSFYVVGDFGLVGGLSLLLLYGVPLGLVLASARRRFDIGHGVAAILGATLWNEALVHACMDFGALPFTGRNLPLLSVNSNTDILRWTLLLAVAAQALLWRTTQAEEEFAPDEKGDPMLPVADGTDEPSARRLGLALAVLALPSALFFLAFVVRPGFRILLDKDLDRPFTWSYLLEAVQKALDAPESEGIAFDAASGRLILPTGGKGRTLLDLEVARFNALPRAERVPEPPDLAGPLAQTRTLEQYDELVGTLRRTSSRVRRAPSLFRVERRMVADPSTDSASPGWELHEEFRVLANPDYDVRLSFKEPPGPEKMVRTALASRSPAAPPLVLTGPAWIMGEWRSVGNPRSPLPWTPYLTSALAEEWDARGAGDAAKAFGTLTLDPELQASTQAFVAGKGRSLHALRLAEPRAAGSWRSALPPRAAIAVLDAVSGEVLALGGWPRMTPTRNWAKGAGGEWLPPSRWLDDTAVPHELRRRYQGERAFDAVEMGSASKPMWAAAALRVHPELDRRLMVQGGEFDNELFGVVVSDKGWHVGASGWRGFDDFLALSDNRYQVRLGFLGLAETDEKGNFRTDGSTGGTSESISGRTPRPWGRFPLFPPALGFTPDTPRKLGSVHTTKLATAMKEIFGAGVAKGDASPNRISFWTGREEPEEGAQASGLGYLVPEPVNLWLDEIRSPRDFVSTLLGGRQNRFSAVGHAAAFTTCVTGVPVVPHLARVEKTSTARQSIPEEAKRMRDGLYACVSRGTAFGALGKEARAVIAGIPGARAYAKTGTLAVSGTGHETSRIALSVLRWKGNGEGTPLRGLTIAVLAEQAGQGLATRWLGEYLVENAALIRWYMYPEKERPTVGERGTAKPSAPGVRTPSAVKQKRKVAGPAKGRTERRTQRR